MVLEEGVLVSLSELVVLGLARGIDNNGAALEEMVSAPIESQSSWLPALPHVLTAAMANFMFGYHIGYVVSTLGLSIFTMSLELNGGKNGTQTLSEVVLAE